MADAAQVWVVDDDRSVRFVLAAALGEAGFRVTAFADAAEVLDALASGRVPDLLLRGRGAYVMRRHVSGLLFIGLAALAMTSARPQAS